MSNFRTQKLIPLDSTVFNAYLAIAASMQENSNRVLAIDLDPQANLTLCLLPDYPEDEGQYIGSSVGHDVLRNEAIGRVF